MLYLSNEKADINKPISTLIKQCLFSPEMKLLDELLEEFQNTGNKITLAIDEFGEISGLLTLSRCLEKIVGESIEENGNNKSKIVKVSNEQFIVDASISINEINDEINIDIPEGRYETLAGFIIDRLQSIPEKNTTTNYKGYRFTILETSKNKISKIQIRILSVPSRKNVEN